eukprot:CAMPEP_0206417630 /NCGR_PEP_ID=MMETSP0294-20121207/37439_1 /ASSEMBLY_ACC=CAM_ASM_000327 /TAXON_ID=39354 /ORGANISM="Heterosigma akashiwo, Strain CCMP2393" /LENGTH=91 /DNA_ID=CAMNT_0053880477 /DNA_START=192 /DNA_END=464 /DNA_ORIENTATION=-
MIAPRTVGGSVSLRALPLHAAKVEDPSETTAPSTAEPPLLPPPESSRQGARQKTQVFSSPWRRLLAAHWRWQAACSAFLHPSRQCVSGSPR